MRYAQPYDEASARYHSRSKDKHHHRDSRRYDHASHPSRDSHGRRPSHSSRRDTQHSQDSRHSQDSHHGSRSSRAPWTPSTYGTYILPLETPGDYRTRDPTECRCTCCPHPSIVSRSHHERHRHQAYPQPPYDSPRRAEQPRRSGGHTGHTWDKRPLDPKFVIEVVDNSRGPLRCQYGNRYPLVLSSASSVASVLSFLAPDRRRAKVVIHWNDGDQEPLDDRVPLEEVRRCAKHLEVKESKRVHWE